MPGPGDVCAAPNCDKRIPAGMRADAKYHDASCKREARLVRTDEPPSGLIKLPATRQQTLTPRR